MENEKPNDAQNEISSSPELLKWLESFEVTDKTSNNTSNKKHINNIWINIGREIYARKTLMLAASKDLKMYEVNNPLLLAATDVFVEKAQLKLTERGKTFYRYGVSIAIIAVVILVTSIVVVVTSNINTLTGDGYKLDNYYVLSYTLFKATTISALVFAITYFLFSLSNALFHEATVLFSRRHALRFGRLFVYLKEGNVTLKELESAFKWNEDFSSAFRDFRVDKATKTIWMKLLELPTDIIKNMGKFSTKFSKNEKNTTTN